MARGPDPRTEVVVLDAMDLATVEALFAICAIAGLAMPVPEDVPLLLAGAAIAGGTFAPGPAMAAALLGVLVRDVLAWVFGHLLGMRLAQGRSIGRLGRSARVERARERLAAQGGRAVLAGRFLLGARVPMFLAAGLAGVPLRTFLLWDIPGLLVVVPLTVGVGWLAGPLAVTGLQAALPYARVLVTSGLIAGLVWIVLRPDGGTGPADAEDGPPLPPNDAPPPT